ncbi:SPOR domain-containing protein, partial [Hyphomicrobium sp.]|uniref:SPOR domain-containing protein n=1 Tax=Hyphomicrobium sp. TaxID=82 RepID=UPI0025C1B38F
ASTGTGGAGFVAVLASVPHSASSRIDALKRFADMQQKYSTALAGKTPDIASANLSKGTYDRLIVGPPGSREEASNVCSQLKSAGYSGCWVTSY